MATSNLLGKREPTYDLETKPILKRRKENSEEKETTKGFSDSLQPIGTKSDQANLRPVKETVGGLDYVETVAARKKTLSVYHIYPRLTMSDLINFFKDVAQVVRVRCFVSVNGRYNGFSTVEFASANEAMKALEKKNGEHLGRGKISLRVVTKPPYPPRPKYCLEHKVWNDDYLRRESFPMEGEEIPPHFFEAVAAREQTLFVANLSPQTRILHVINFFETYTQCLRVRLIVNHEGKHVGYGFVEFASAKEAEKALEGKNGKYLHGHKIFLDVAPYAPRPKYSLVEKLWYEDYLRREGLLIEEEEAVEGPDLAEEVAVREKTLFYTDCSPGSNIQLIIRFFEDVAKVKSIRFMVDDEGKRLGSGFLEFASANDAKKAQKEKFGEKFQGRIISLFMAKIAPYPLRPKYNLAEKLRYEDYRQRESLLIEEEVDLESKPIRRRQKKHIGVFSGKKITFSDDD